MEYKFRAWDEKLKLKLYGDDIEEGENYHTGLSYGKLFIAYKSEESDWDELSIMQYTGLKDKNGIEIYCGDLLERISGFYIVVWDNVSCGFKKKSLSGGMLSLSGNQNKVIGNIYENSELIKD